MGTIETKKCKQKKPTQMGTIRTKINTIEHKNVKKQRRSKKLQLGPKSLKQKRGGPKGLKVRAKVKGKQKRLKKRSGPNGPNWDPVGLESFDIVDPWSTARIIA